MVPTPDTASTTGTDRATGGVQSVERAFQLLEALADSGGVATLSELSASSGLPMPTIHRLVRTLVQQGYVRQDTARRYTLGPRLIRLGETAGRLLGSWARPYLAELMEATGETANLAVLEGGEVVYVGQVQSRRSMRMFTEVGRRVQPHCTGVGKALLAQLPEDEARAILGPNPLPAHTEYTVTDPQELLQQLAEARERGYVVDDQEQEIGVRCIALAVPGAPTPTALSVSGPEARIRALEEQTGASSLVPVMHHIATRLGQVLAP
ncbi:IclR family acetate operon transcriptional repressor [Kitasatospora sp. MAA19]|uniref:IclR family transcriptional regulator n=1 Tax=Kitasatospora sp. MAA19 TaxID=3035090 RepID=UPI002476A869|nr:IclR family transcriptional regulator [Kitasatospora sp. MAA19]MDH6706781.1 IclR family acetate operon transcriptional repressor [Kitasatospora sp. MAA19]